ncbi:protein export chaperone SecB [Endozoicomonas sp. SM1973]|uniref:Protein export chaperone SecB n=1 Tax=Spartinivicinus marinus TaxID=2994442 RepID=A0A853INY1_9GAMM|nr:protein export chaperone SecB [Spartinivicinus marinus]MCX4030225.1 hypothetical protein [Spartinivicinus marinus]NYZ69576.1 protein export chaperone SecB [Spartinivicinus marinus]
MKEWDEVKEEFEADGSLRDIYVEEVNISEWNSFISAILRSKYRIKFIHGDREISLPEDFGSIKKLQLEEPTTLHIWVTDKTQLNCHFFIESEIELDVSPYDIQDSASYSSLVSFLKWLAALLGKQVKLTHEGMQNQVILSVTN